LIDISASDELVSHLKVVSKQNDANGYYAGRILCDILPLMSQLDGLDANAAAEELKGAKHGSQRGKEGSLPHRHQYDTDLSREFSASIAGDRLC
jgi:hypothetical protein